MADGATCALRAFWMCCLCCLVWGNGPALADDGVPVSPAAGAERRELWTGSLYTSTYRIGVCIKPSGEVRGVVLLRVYTGDVDVYHITGRIRDGELAATHHSGHSFKGHYTSPDTVSGVITLKKGQRLRLNAQRAREARLSDDDCRPLP